MARPLTPLQAHENRLFLDALGRTGNARMAAREVGRPANSFHYRRKRHPGFAQDWAATVAATHARLHLAGGKRGPESSVIASEAKQSRKARRRDAAAGLLPRSAPRNDGSEAFRTKGGEPIVVRTRNGKLQIRLAHPGKLTKACEQAFLYALSATANVRLAAAAAGASARAFYRRRKENPAFAREMRIALKMGWERLEIAAMEAAKPESHSDDRWRNCELAPMPRFTPTQAVQLLSLHDKSVNQSWEAPHRHRRRGESDEIYSQRLQAMWRVECNLEAEREALRRAARYEETGDWRHEDELPPPVLPPLSQVTGWSRASGRPAHHEGVALFGGWRIGDMRRRLGEG
ncbi:MAG TPA: hypothetical protein VE891_09705 [Allosphingosinicella sp.]|nr:hypothetical protein [Allosphingosinicella sp.]